MTESSDPLARLRARSIEAGRFVLPLDPVWADKLINAYEAVNRARLYSDEGDKAQRVAEAQATVDAIAESAGENVIVFRMKRLSRAEYDALVTRHPPTPAQRKEDEDKPRGDRRAFDQDTWAPELVSLVCYDPPLTLEQATALIQGGGDQDLALSKGEAEAFTWTAQAAALAIPRTVPKELKLP
jgi:hypothetical protein